MGEMKLKWLSTSFLSVDDFLSINSTIDQFKSRRVLWLFSCCSFDMLISFFPVHFLSFSLFLGAIRKTRLCRWRRLMREMKNNLWSDLSLAEIYPLLIEIQAEAAPSERIAKDRRLLKEQELRNPLQHSKFCPDRPSLSSAFKTILVLRLRLLNVLYLNSGSKLWIKQITLIHIPQ